MIHVEFDPEKLTGEQKEWWDGWQKRANDATLEVIELWEKWRSDPRKDEFKKIFDRTRITKIWGELKDWLLKNVFHNKCAYCETPVGRSIFHAEHYRPKKGVTTEKGRVKIRDAGGQECDHPGYFWLAFHWQNLLPSCARCNSPNKKNRFPLPEQKPHLSILQVLEGSYLKRLRHQIIESKRTNGIYYLQPADLNQFEGRVFLHPYFDEPQRYFTFDDFGQIVPIGTEEEQMIAQQSIEAYNLNGDSIVEERRKAQFDAERRYYDAYCTYRDRKDRVFTKSEARIAAKDAIRGFLEGREAYSAAVVAYLKEEFPDYIK